MNTQSRTGNPATRRAFLGTAATAAACAVMPRHVLGAGADRPNSVFQGVRIGCITYSYRGEINSAEDTLKALIEDGLSEVELMDGPIRSYTGIAGGGRRGTGAQPTPPTDAERQAQLAKCAELRKMYNDAGVNIHIHKIPFGQSDEEIGFNFEVAKALGCIGITLERSEPLAKRLAPFASKYKIWVAFHNHTNNYPVMDKPDPILEHGEYIGFNFDVGHYFAGTKGRSPLPVLEKYHDRIVSLHMKDRSAEGANLPWGMGGTPLKEILQLMKKEKWTFPADIEVEYKIPPGSSAVAEVAKCVQYCKDALA
jgi:sugar phosphate isomerase/epimerase